MLKIKKLKPDNLDSLEFNDYKKIVRPLLLGTSKLHKSATNPVDFFVLTDFEFADKPGKKTMLFIPGKQTAEWKKYLKTKFKEDKKNMMMGSCYVTESDGKQFLNLSPQRGVAKMVKIKKQGKRMFAMAKLLVQLASGAEEIKEASGGIAAANMGGRIIDENDDNDDDDNNENTTDSRENNGKANVEELKLQLKALANQINGIKTGIPIIKAAAVKLKNNNATADDTDQVELVLDEMESFLEEFNEAHPKVKERIASAKTKVEAQIGQVSKLLERLQQVAPQTIEDFEEEEEEDAIDEQTELEEDEVLEETETRSEEEYQEDIDEAATDIENLSTEEQEEEDDTENEDTILSAAEIEILTQSMSRAKTEITKLLQELDLDELLKEVA